MFEITDRVNRLKKIVTEIEELVGKVGPLLIRISHLRTEALEIEKQIEQAAKEKIEKSTRKSEKT